jgi:hypothetical protein
MSHSNDHQLEEDSTLPISVGKWKGQRAVKGKIVDPTAALPGAMKHVGGNLDIKTVRNKSDKQLQQKAKQYMRHLVTFQGDQIKALMATYSITEAEAVSEREDLHGALLKATHGQTITDILKSSDLDRNSRVQILREHVFSPVPAVSLKALEAINELDGASRSGGDSWESFIALALSNNKKKKNE